MPLFRRRPPTAAADAWRSGELDVPDPAVLRLAPPTADQLQRISTAIRLLGTGTDDLPTLGSAYDATYQAWSVRPEGAREDASPLVERLAAGLGQYLVDRARMSWRCGTDPAGTEYAVVAGPDGRVLHPAGLVATHWSRGQVGWVVDVITTIRQSITDPDPA